MLSQFTIFGDWEVFKQELVKHKAGINWSNATQARFQEKQGEDNLNVFSFWAKTDVILYNPSFSPFPNWSS